MGLSTSCTIVCVSLLMSPVVAMTFPNPALFASADEATDDRSAPIAATTCVDVAPIVVTCTWVVSTVDLTPCRTWRIPLVDSMLYLTLSLRGPDGRIP